MQGLGERENPDGTAYRYKSYDPKREREASLRTALVRGEGEVGLSGISQLGPSRRQARK